MAKYDEIKRNLEALRTNKIGNKFLSITNIASFYNYRIDDVRPVVEDLVAEGKMSFRQPLVSISSKTYDTEYLTVVKQRKTQRKDNSWKYGI